MYRRNLYPLRNAIRNNNLNPPLHHYTSPNLCFSSEKKVIEGDRMHTSYNNNNKRVEKLVQINRARREAAVARAEERRQQQHWTVERRRRGWAGETGEETAWRRRRRGSVRKMKGLRPKGFLFLIFFLFYFTKWIYLFIFRNGILQSGLSIFFFINYTISLSYFINIHYYFFIFLKV